MTTDEAMALIELPKIFAHPNKVLLPKDGQKKVYQVLGISSKNTFMLDCARSGVIDLKYKTQLRHDKNFALVRLELNAPPHMNPDGTVTSRNHIHIFREGYGLRWAVDLPRNLFNQSPYGIAMEVFTYFCGYCKIDVTGIFQQGVI